MDRIDATLIPEPGLVVLDITAHDEATAHAVMAELERLWTASGITTGCWVAGCPHPRACGHPAPGIRP